MLHFLLKKLVLFQNKAKVIKEKPMYLNNKITLI